MQAALVIKNILQREIDKIDSSLTLEVDSYWQVISVRDKTRNAQREWKYTLPFDAEGAAKSIKYYFDRKREAHPESYATCACHRGQYYGS